MAQKISVPAEIREQIHFDTLWAKVYDVVQRYAGENWTALADHDPGITLLQALTYITSDLSYRHTLPLIDLLTPAKTDRMYREKEGIFAPEFGPERALTCGPVTLDDYRRAILDLHNGTQFYFRDVQIQYELPNERYCYRYDAEERAFKFSTALSSPAPEDFVVHGGYTIWVATNPGINWKGGAKEVLETFLKEHRNLCETVNSTIRLEPQSLNINLIIDLEDDLSEQDAVALMADVFLCTDALVSPTALRSSAKALDAEGQGAEMIYRGPKLEHGWITQLPPPPESNAKKRSIDLRPLAGRLQKLPGVKQVLSVEPTNSEVEFDKYPWAWMGDSGGPDYTTLTNHVKFRKRGQSIVIDHQKLKEQLTIKLKTQQQQGIETEHPRVPYGRFRSPGDYYSAGERLPPCYQLQQEWEILDEKQKNAAKQLYQFLLPFEQWLANGCDQLAKLPSILSFDQRKGDSVWGGSKWLKMEDGFNGVKPEDVLSSVELNKLVKLIDTQSEDNDKELSILNYLLGYFGEDRASRTLLSVKPNEFREVQQGFLSQITSLAYERAAISVSKISALQRRIAARLGVGQELFEKNGKFPNKELPFYIIEHRQLLPAVPSCQVNKEWQKIEEVQHGQNTLTLTLLSVNEMKVGQLIDLQEGEGPNLLPIVANVIHTVSSTKDSAPGKYLNEVSINLAQHVRLKHSVPRIDKATWKWRYSEIWLKRKLYSLEYAKDQLNLTGNTPKRLSINKENRYPVDLKVNDVISLVCDSKQAKSVVPSLSETETLKSSPPTLLRATVLKLDPVQEWIEVDLENGTWPGDTSQYSWTVPYHKDIFSFTISVVLKREWLVQDSAGDPYLTDAWIRQIVAEEVPSHITTKIHWLNEQQYKNFSTSYDAWQMNGMTLGDRSYELLEQLSIGYVPVDTRTGIGVTHIFKESERAIKDLGEKEKNDGQKESEIIKRYEEAQLLYVGK